MIVVKAYAKINLTLDIVGRRNDYHLLDMLVSSIDLYDEVTVIKRNDSLNHCTMDGVVADKNNSAMRAIELMQKEFKTSGFEVHIKKNIPLSGGLGGSTADGVAVVRGIAKLLDIPRKKITNELLLQLGSDGPCMYDLGVKRVEGIGEKVTKLGNIWQHKVGIIAGSGVSTAKAYALFDTMNIKGSRSTMTLLRQLDKGNLDIKGHLNNDLFKPAVTLNGEIEASLDYINSLYPIDASMSGSGSAVYGLFEREVPNKLLKTKLI